MDGVGGKGNLMTFAKKRFDFKLYLSGSYEEVS